MTFTCIFVLERKFAYAWGGAQALFLESTGPGMHFSGTRPSSLFECTIFAWEAKFSLGGMAQAVFWVGTDPKCFQWRRAYT